MEILSKIKISSSILFSKIISKLVINFLEISASSLVKKLSDSSMKRLLKTLFLKINGKEYNKNLSVIN